MKIFEITEDRSTGSLNEFSYKGMKTVMKNGRKVYGHELTNKLWASEQDARSDYFAKKTEKDITDTKDRFLKLMQKVNPKADAHKAWVKYSSNFGMNLKALKASLDKQEKAMGLREFEKLTTFKGKSSDVQDFKEVTPEELKKRLGDILGALGASGALQNLEKNFNKMLQQFKGDIEVMDKILQQKEDELGLSI